MNETQTIPQAESAPVSRIQRFLPFFSYSLMALGGAAAGWYAMSVIGEFGKTADAGIGRIASWLAIGLWSVTTGLVLALLVGFVAIVVFAAMMFAQKRTSTPSAFWLIIVAFVGMLAPMLSWPTLMELIIAPMDPRLDPVQLASSARMYSMAAIVLGVLTPILGLALTFAPFKSMPGKKYGPVVVMILVEALMLVAFIYLKMQAGSIGRMTMGY